MNAIRVEKFGGPEVLRLAEVPVPAPGPGELLVRIRAAGVNPVETYIRSGNYARVPALPYTPGTDAGGVIEAVGADVTGWHAGDRVYLAGARTGTYAELAVCAAAQAHRLPEGVTFAQGAAMGVAYGTAWRALVDRGQARPGETVLVHGASGGVGTATVQIARALGLRILGTAGTPKGRDLVQAEGAHAVFDHHAADYLEQIRAATGGHGVDLVIEFLANVNLGKDLTLLAPHGRVIVVGSRGRVELDPRDGMKREADIRTTSLANATPQELARIHAGLVAGLEARTLRPVIGREFPLAQAADAHHAVMQAGAHGKIVLLP